MRLALLLLYLSLLLQDSLPSPASKPLLHPENAWACPSQVILPILKNPKFWIRRRETQTFTFNVFNNVASGVQLHLQRHHNGGKHWVIWSLMWCVRNNHNRFCIFFQFHIIIFSHFICSKHGFASSVRGSLCYEEPFKISMQPTFLIFTQPNASVKQ